MHIVFFQNVSVAMHTGSRLLSWKTVSLGR